MRKENDRKWERRREWVKNAESTCSSISFFSFCRCVVAHIQLETENKRYGLQSIVRNEFQRCIDLVFFRSPVRSLVRSGNNFYPVALSNLFTIRMHKQWPPILHKNHSPHSKHSPWNWFRVDLRALDEERNNKSLETNQNIRVIWYGCGHVICMNWFWCPVNHLQFRLTFNVYGLSVHNYPANQWARQSAGRAYGNCGWRDGMQEVNSCQMECIFSSTN